MERKIIKTNFWNVGTDGDRNLYEDDLGLDSSENLIQDAQSDEPEDIFRYYIEVVGLNMLFYWTEDERFYTIETEKSPVEVRRIYPNPDYNGKSELSKAGSGLGPCTSSPGEIIATFDEPCEVWDNLKISGVPIGNVLKKSVIITLD